MISPQTLGRAADLFVDWLATEVESEGRGDRFERLDVAPSATFWLGRLATEESIRNSPHGERSERLEPCAIGIRLRPAGEAPVRLRVTARARAWIHDAATDQDRPWRRSDPVAVICDVEVTGSGITVAGAEELAAAFARVGAAHLRAVVRVEQQVPTRRRSTRSCARPKIGCRTGQMSSQSGCRRRSKST